MNESLASKRNRIALTKFSSEWQVNITIVTMTSK